jgi:hypothetical protein
MRAVCPDDELGGSVRQFTCIHLSSSVHRHIRCWAVLSAPARVGVGQLGTQAAAPWSWYFVVVCSWWAAGVHGHLCTDAPSKPGRSAANHAAPCNAASSKLRPTMTSPMAIMHRCAGY